MWTPVEPNRMSWTYSSGDHWLRLVWALAYIPSAIFHCAYVFLYFTLEGHILSYSFSSMWQCRKKKSYSRTCRYIHPVCVYSSMNTHMTSNTSYNIVQQRSDFSPSPDPNYCTYSICSLTAYIPPPPPPCNNVRVVLRFPGNYTILLLKNE